MKHAHPKYDPIQDSTGLIPQEEPIFLLRGTDPCTPAAIEAWLLTAEKQGVPPLRLSDVRVHLLTITDYQLHHKHLLHLPGTPRT